MPDRMVAIATTVLIYWRRCVAKAAAAAIMAVVCPIALAAQTDSTAIWTAALQSGTVDAKAIAVDGLLREPASSLPPATVQALLAELGRINQALLNGTDPGMPGTADDDGEYYINLVSIVADLRTPAAALALVPAVSVSNAVQRRVARYGGDAAVASLATLVAQRYSPDDALETLGLTWFWADSTGSALSDSSRRTIMATLAASASTGDDEDMLGVSAALRDMGDPTFLGLAQLLRAAAVAQGSAGQFVVTRLDQDVLPQLTAASASRTNASLVLAISQAAAAVCASPSTGQRHGVCQSSGNDLANAAKHFGRGQFGPARNEYTTVANKFAAASTLFTAAEYALLTSDLNTLLSRSW